MGVGMVWMGMWLGLDGLATGSAALVVVVPGHRRKSRHPLAQSHRMQLSQRRSHDHRYV